MFSRAKPLTALLYGPIQHLPAVDQIEEYDDTSSEIQQQVNALANEAIAQHEQNKVPLLLADSSLQNHILFAAQARDASFAAGVRARELVESGKAADPLAYQEVIELLPPRAARGDDDFDKWHVGMVIGVIALAFA